MSTEKNWEQNREQNEDKNPKTEETTYRLTVSKSAEQALMGVMERVNDGFEGGRVSRTDLASWVLVKFAERVSENDVREIRAEHFNELALLESIYRRSRESGRVPPELRALLQSQIGLEPAPKRPGKGRLTKAYTNDVMSSVLDADKEEK